MVISKVTIELSENFDDSAQFPIHDVRIKPSLIEEIKKHLKNYGLNVTSHLRIKDENLTGEFSMEMIDYKPDPNSIEAAILRGNHDDANVEIRISPRKIKPYLQQSYFGDYYLQKEWKVRITVSSKREIDNIDKFYKIGLEIVDILEKNSYTQRGEEIKENWKDLGRELKRIINKD